MMEASKEMDEWVSVGDQNADEFKKVDEVAVTMDEEEREDEQAACHDEEEEVGSSASSLPVENEEEEEEEEEDDDDDEISKSQVLDETPNLLQEEELELDEDDDEEEVDVEGETDEDGDSDQDAVQEAKKPIRFNRRKTVLSSTFNVLLFGDPDGDTVAYMLEWLNWSKAGSCIEKLKSAKNKKIDRHVKLCFVDEFDGDNVDIIVFVVDTLDESTIQKHLTNFVFPLPDGSSTGDDSCSSIAFLPILRQGVEETEPTTGSMEERLGELVRSSLPKCFQCHPLIHVGSKDMTNLCNVLETITFEDDDLLLQGEQEVHGVANMRGHDTTRNNEFGTQELVLATFVAGTSCCLGSFMGPQISSGSYCVGNFCLCVSLVVLMLHWNKQKHRSMMLTGLIALNTAALIIFLRAPDQMVDQQDEVTRLKYLLMNASREANATLTQTQSMLQDCTHSENELYNKVRILRYFLTEALHICGWWCDDTKSMMRETYSLTFKDDAHNPTLIFE